MDVAVVYPLSIVLIIFLPLLWWILSISLRYIGDDHRFGEFWALQVIVGSEIW